MKIGILMKEQRELFADMDPFWMMERLELPGYFAMAATEFDEEENSELPAGLMIGEILSDKLIVEWIYVQNEFRSRGIGAQLLDAAFTIARKNNLPTVCAYLSEEWGRELVCPSEEVFLEAYGFGNRSSLAGEWLTNLQALSEQEYFQQPTDDLPIVTPLQQLTRSQAKTALDTLAGKEDAAMLCPINGQQASFDEELSFLLSSKGEIKGGILVKCLSRNRNEVREGKVVLLAKEKVLYPVLLCASSESEQQALLSAALQAAMKKYAKDTEVHILLRDDRLDPFLKKLRLDDAIPCSMLSANVEEYFHREVPQDGYLFL